MSLYARIYLREWFLSPWPERDLDKHVDIINGIKEMIRKGLVTKEELYHLFRYLAGYKDYSREEQLQRILTICATFFHIEDAHYARQKLYARGITDEQIITTRIAQMGAIGLWVNDN